MHKTIAPWVNFRFPHYSPYIEIFSDKRERFLRIGSEEQAETEVKRVSLGVRSVAGGYFQIHPVYGLVWGTKLSRVNPEVVDLLDFLSVKIFIANPSPFDPQLIELCKRVIRSPDQDLSDRVDRMERRSGNCNHYTWTAAMISGLQGPWEAQFREYNPHCPLPGTGLVDRWSRLLRRDKTQIPSAIAAYRPAIAEAFARIEAKLNLSLGPMEISTWYDF